MATPALLVLAFTAGALLWVCSTQQFVCPHSDYCSFLLTTMTTGSNSVSLGLRAINMTYSQPDSWVYWDYYGDNNYYDYELDPDKYGDHIAFTGTACVQFSLATEAGGVAVPGAMLVQEDVWAGADALERLPSYVNFSNAPGALPASLCLTQCQDLTIETNPVSPYQMLLMTDGPSGTAPDFYTLNLTAYGHNAPECEGAASTTPIPYTSQTQQPQGEVGGPVAMRYQKLEGISQPSASTPNFTASPMFLVHGASCVYYTLWLPPGVPSTDSGLYSLTLYATDQLAAALAAPGNTAVYQLGSCTGATCNSTHWHKNYGLGTASYYWLVSSFQWALAAQPDRFWSLAQVFQPDECQALQKGDTDNSPADANGSSPGAAAASSSALSPANADSSSSSSTGAIAGGVVGGVAALAALGAATFLIFRRRKRAQTISNAPFASSSKASGSITLESWTSPESKFSWHKDDGSSGGSPGTSSAATTAAHSRGTSASEESWLIEARRITFRLGSDGAPQKLGQGGFGSVYLGVQDGVREVACKVLHACGGSLQEEKAFREEINRLAECRDRNVVQFYGAVLGAETVLVTEYCENGDLFTALADGSDVCLWHQRGQSIALDVAKGLHALHSRRIVHLDIKSPNILLTKNYEAKIADVGLSYQLHSQTHASNVSNRGTWAWQSPEILLGRGAGTAADVWSYGVVLYEILSGEKPRRGRLRQISVPEEGPLEAEQLMEACLLDDPAQRPTMREIIERLQLFVRP